MSDRELTPMQEFLMYAPAGSTIANTYNKDARNDYYFEVPREVTFYCKSPECSKQMTFARVENSSHWHFHDKLDYGLVGYRCRHCQKEYRYFALSLSPPNLLKKLGVYPVDSEPLPENLLEIADFDKEMLLKGYEAEIDGYGLGAFTYYRRVVENRWQGFLKAMLEVAEATSADPDIISHLKAAQKQRQFEQAVNSVKDAIPREFFHKGNQNLFTLLHSMSSIGVHNLTEVECLAHARALRLLLILFVRRSAQALAEVDTIEDAVKVVAKVVQTSRTKATP